MNHIVKISLDGALKAIGNMIRFLVMLSDKEKKECMKGS